MVIRHSIKELLAKSMVTRPMKCIVVSIKLNAVFYLNSNVWVSSMHIISLHLIYIYFAHLYFIILYILINSYVHYVMWTVMFSMSNMHMHKPFYHASEDVFLTQWIAISLPCTWNEMYWKFALIGGMLYWHISSWFSLPRTTIGFLLFPPACRSKF